MLTSFKTAADENRGVINRLVRRVSFLEETTLLTNETSSQEDERRAGRKIRQSQGGPGLGMRLSFMQVKEIAPETNTEKDKTFYGLQPAAKI